MSKKEKFALYLTPEKKARLERRYQEDGSRSITGFIERAIDFYLDYLSANNAGLFLPTSIQSYLDGRVGQTENKMASLAYKQDVYKRQSRYRSATVCHQSATRSMFFCVGWFFMSSA